MKVIKKFNVGSSAYFIGMEGFSPKDTDYVCLVEDYIGGDKTMRINLKGNDLIMYRHDYTKEEFIREALRCGVSLKIGKFLAPEFVRAFDITLEDLSRLKPLVDGLDEKHKYERIIYDAYIENGSFTLTDEQRMAAFETYKAAREKKE